MQFALIALNMRNSSQGLFYSSMSTRAHIKNSHDARNATPHFVRIWACFVNICESIFEFAHRSYRVSHQCIHTQRENLPQILPILTLISFILSHNHRKSYLYIRRKCTANLTCTCHRYSEQYVDIDVAKYFVKIQFEIPATTKQFWLQLFAAFVCVCVCVHPVLFYFCLVFLAIVFFC